MRLPDERHDGRAVVALYLRDLDEAQLLPESAYLLPAAQRRRPLAVQHVLDAGRRIHLLADGRVVNLADEVARLKLDSLRVEIDSLREEQERYLHSWEQGT